MKSIVRFSNQRTPIGLKWVTWILLILVVVIYGYSFAWSKAAKYAQKTFHKEVKKVSSRLGIPIEYGPTTFKLSGLIVEDIRIGTNAPIVINQIRCQVGLLPWSDDFSKPTLIMIDRAKIKTPLSSLNSIESLDHFTKMASDFQKSPQKSPNTQGNQRDRMLDLFFKALPASRVEVASAGLVILSDQGEQLLAFKGLKLNIDQKSKKLLFKIDRIRRVNGPLDGYLQGRFETNPKGYRGDYRFFVRRKAGPSSSKNLWAIAGMVAKDASRWSLAGDFHVLPTFFGNDLEFILGKNPKLGLSGKMEGVRAENTPELALNQAFPGSTLSRWNIKLAIKSNQTILDSPMLHSKPIGPITFQLTTQGLWDILGKQLILKSGKLTLPVATEDNESLQVDFSGNIQRTVQKENLGLKLSGNIDIPPTPCNRFIKGLPQALVPLLHEFQLEGTMSGKLAIEVDTLSPDTNQIQLNNPQWNCQVKEAPYDLTTAGLLGSFDFQPKVPVADIDDHDPVRVSVENRFFAPLSTLPKTVIGAFIASEDANFFNHQGIETQAILGAFRKNVAKGRIAVGGSTITMQTAKNLFLSHDRTLSRKIQEIFLAWHMEKTIPKERILEIYLNIIEFGPRIYGLGHASQHFFSKEPQNINLLEASFLANLLPNPKQRYLSFCQGKLTSGMTSLMVGLLKRMISLGKISHEDFQEALATGLKFNSSARASDAICLERTALKADKEKASPL